MLSEQEIKVNEAFSKQSLYFDAKDKSNGIIQGMRNTVRTHVLSVLKPGSRILELNAGTGLDAVFFAQNGFYVHATDNAEGMLDEIKKKVISCQLSGKLSTEQCSFNELQKLSGKTFDHIFSNFGGLNCTPDLASVIGSFEDLLKPGGTATLVIMPPVSPWELITAFKGNFKLAFRRFKKDGALSHLEGVHFKTYYYSSAYVRKAFGKNFKLVKLKGLASISPPPYLHYFPKKYPKLYNLFAGLDKKLSSYFPFNRWADHFIITVGKR